MQPAKTRQRKYTVTAKVVAANRAKLLKANAVPKKILYRLTPRRLAACRANLVKANAVDVSIRYRPTRRRLAACRANLLKARGVLRAAGDRSPAYGVCFRHGLYAVSLRRSAWLAGEDPAEFDAHLERFVCAFRPRGALERKLVRGLAETAWRRLRVFGGQSNWERLSLAYRLREACQPIVVPPGGPPPPELDPINRHHGLADEVVGIFLNDAASGDSIRKLHERFERLGRLLVAERAPQAPPFAYLTRPRPSERRLAQGPPAALGNPFRSASSVAQSLQPKPFALGRFESWGWGEKAGEIRALRPFQHDDVAGLGKALRYGLVRRGLAEAEGAAPGAPELTDFASLSRLLQAAFDSAAQEIRPVAELVWQRLGVYARQGREEAGALRLVLEQARASGRGSRSPLATRQLIGRLLGVFLKDLVVTAAAFNLYCQLKNALYLLLTNRYGVRPRFEGLKPLPPPADEREGATLTNLLNWLALLPLDRSRSPG